MSAKEIATELYISELTVRKHIQNIYSKCNVHSKDQFKNLYLKKVGELNE
jgi:DNA-binding NarL/FixJ family response regulator